MLVSRNKRRPYVSLIWCITPSGHGNGLRPWIRNNGWRTAHEPLNLTLDLEHAHVSGHPAGLDQRLKSGHNPPSLSTMRSGGCRVNSRRSTTSPSVERSLARNDWTSAAHRASAQPPAGPDLRDRGGRRAYGTGGPCRCPSYRTTSARCQIVRQARESPGSPTRTTGA
jgi:hypothetical protein